MLDGWNYSFNVREKWMKFWDVVIFPTLLSARVLLVCSCLGLRSHGAKTCWVWSLELGSLLELGHASQQFALLFVKVCSLNEFAKLSILNLAFVGFVPL